MYQICVEQSLLVVSHKPDAAMLHSLGVFQSQGVGSRTLQVCEMVRAEGHCVCFHFRMLCVQCELKEIANKFYQVIKLEKFRIFSSHTYCNHTFAIQSNFCCTNSRISHLFQMFVAQTDECSIKFKSLWLDSQSINWSKKVGVNSITPFFVLKGLLLVLL